VFAKLVLKHYVLVASADGVAAIFLMLTYVQNILNGAARLLLNLKTVRSYHKLQRSSFLVDLENIWRRL